MAILESGRLLAGHYLLEQRLGDGGHAEVWAARDARDDRRVALKFLRLAAGSPEDALQVLRHEASMARRLDHPGVLRVEEPVRDESLVFLPEEFAAGESVAVLRGASWQRVLPPLLEVAKVLEHAHSRGVVHRDIKPGNVLFDDDGVVKIADFGASARTGSDAALAPGSPFSASPQQLRGEAATTADDVYGLGALAYELLTRYPPFYPNFDAERVQRQEPPRPQPVHPAPSQLLDLVQQMLARDAAARPDLVRVMQVFSDCLEEGESVGSASGEVVVEALAAGTSPAPERRRSPSLGWLLAGAVVVAAGLLWWMSGLQAGPATPELQVPETVVTDVADAVLDVPAEVPGQPDTPAVRATAEDEMRAGAAALASGQPALARAAFQRVLAQVPGDAKAEAGIESAAALEKLLALLAEGTRAETRGELETAVSRYQAVLAGRADFAPARDGLARIRRRQSDEQFERLLATGADALRLGWVEEARDIYQQAAAMRGDDARAQEGQQRVAEVLRDRRNAADLATGTGLERQERWAEALAHYQQVAVRDPSLGFVKDGIARSERAAALDRELQDYLARPERLTTPAVRLAAERALARGEASAAQAPRLQGQLQQLGVELKKLDVQVRVPLVSDNNTLVSVAPVGKLGQFTSHELQLLPGHYTVIGQRDGYRDVRYELEVTPGKAVAPLTVRCTERI